mmetsp:Transcript_6429/g.24006  ORF Transcript_6429/g.24006 Transcript_6429/m.24006 type:complete len:97 (+) Transcript_6429:887-1177(+)
MLGDNGHLIVAALRLSFLMLIHSVQISVASQRAAMDCTFLSGSIMGRVALPSTPHLLDSMMGTSVWIWREGVCEISSLEPSSGTSPTLVRSGSSHL